MEEETARVSLHGGSCLGSEPGQTSVQKEHGAKKGSSSRGDAQQAQCPPPPPAPFGKSSFPHTFPKILAEYDDGQHPRIFPKGICFYLLLEKPSPEDMKLLANDLRLRQLHFPACSKTAQESPFLSCPSGCLSTSEA